MLHKYAIRFLLKLTSYHFNGKLYVTIKITVINTMKLPHHDYSDHCHLFLYHHVTDCY